ncbi:hypothetical protein FGG78_21305 [Thioclava sp. BHET1]|nr:hypothetical protein FGG78_21305 [Thioclava sp. BHET1]
MPPDPQLPDALRRHCARSASDLALELLTTDADGWPHVAYLSVGETVIDGEGAIRVALWGHSRSTASLNGSRRAVLIITASEAVFELRCRAAPLAPLPAFPQLSAFRLQPEALRNKSAPYADIVSGIRFRLHDPAATHRRWRDLRAALLAVPPGAERSDGPGQ